MAYEGRESLLNMTADLTPSHDSLLIIFYRNPVLGKVKTRLAETIGDAQALNVYQKLARHTNDITVHLPIDKAVYYSDSVDAADRWSNDSYQKHLQKGNSLGERMSNAFETSFSSGYQRVCIIGTDCFELSAAIIEEAFNRLPSHDAVIGPATDGGYYLLGMKRFHANIFENKRWSTDSVFAETVNDFKIHRFRYHQLPVLPDVDEEKDLPKGLFLF